MDEALKMMAEYILEENVSQKREIRSLKETIESQKRDIEYLRESLGQQGADRSTVRSTLSRYAKWEDGKLQYISVYNNDALKTLCDILCLHENDKAIL